MILRGINMLNEKQFKKQFSKDVLVYLIEKYESSKAFLTGTPTKQRPQISFKRNNPFMKDYLDRSDFYKRIWMHEGLIALEQKKIISILWEEDKVGQNLSRVYLNTDRLHEAYELTNLVPRLEKINRLLTIFKPLLDHPWSWLQEFAEEIIGDLENRKQSGFNLDRPKVHQDVVQVLEYLPEIEGSITKRALSRQLFGDVKHFETSVEQPVITFVNRAHPVSFTSNEELLAFFGIVPEVKLVQLKGAMEWTMDGITTNSTASYTGGLGFSNSTVKQMEIAGINEEKIILIESATSYEQWINQRPDERELVIYVGGYPHLLLQTFLEKLSRFLKNAGNKAVPVLYWGDVDIDGIAIYEYMKVRFFAALEPILMDKQSLLQFKESAVANTEEYNEKVEKMIEDPAYAAWLPVLKEMLKSNIRLEQEEIVDVSKIK